MSNEQEFREEMVEQENGETDGTAVDADSGSDDVAGSEENGKDGQRADAEESGRERVGETGPDPDGPRVAKVGTGVIGFATATDWEFVDPDLEKYGHF